jgi:hypothetical protein
MHCRRAGCTGELENGTCSVCGDKAAADPKKAMNLQKVSARLKAVDGKDALLQASEALKTVVPDKYESWRAQADLWLAAIRQLETRQLSADDSVELMGVPLIEKNLRDAAEEALRQCAHFAPSLEQRIALIDEANSIRNMSWL